MQIQKKFAVALAAVFILAASACSSGGDANVQETSEQPTVETVDTAQLEDLLDEVTGKYDTVNALASENGWDEDEIAMEDLNNAYDTINNVADALDSDDLTQAQVDSYVSDLETLSSTLDTLQAQFSATYSSSNDDSE